MKHMSLREITQVCNGVYRGNENLFDCCVSSVTIDSRKIEKNGLFVAIKGARVDGHDFIEQVMEAGALCSLTEKYLENTNYPYILVDDCKTALKALAEHYRRSLDIKVIGISGSVGKTSTKEMVASVLSQKYRVLKTAGNFNNEIGLPLTIFNIREEHEVAVLEMGISDFGEMTRLAKMARPDICIITNIGCAHLEQLGNRDGILQAKTEMFAYKNPGGSILLNGDDDKLRGYRPDNHEQPIYFGLTHTSDFYVKETIGCGLEGTDALFVTPRSEFYAHIPIPGEHMVYNALAGIAAGYALDMTDDEIKKGIEALVPIAGRNHMIHTKTLHIIDDCYNANPVSMKSSLNVVKEAKSRTVAILGNMGELGKKSEQMHYEIGEYAVESNINLLICIGSLCKYMADGAENRLKELNSDATTVYYYETKEDFLTDLPSLIQPDDTILVKASHAMQFAEIVEKLQKL